MDQECRLEQIRTLQWAMEVCPFIMGADVLAAENNSTYDMMHELKLFLLWIRANFPGAVLRVHAGETSYHPENIAGAVELAQFAPWAKIRIGHGIHGVHDHVKSYMKNLSNVIAECNPCSNVALNMHFDVSTHTLEAYIKNNIPVVLGSDGFGLYQSCAIDLIKPLSTMAIDVQGYLRTLRDIEREYITYVEKVKLTRTLLAIQTFIKTLTPQDIKRFVTDYPRFSEDFLLALQSWDAVKIDEYLQAFESNPLSYSHPMIVFQQLLETDPYQKEWLEWEKDRAQEKSAFESGRHIQKILYINKEQEFQNALSCFCSKHGINLQHTSILSHRDLFSGKIPIMINGIILDPDQPYYVTALSEVSTMIMTILNTLDPAKYYFITTGTHIGIQQTLHTLVNYYNDSYPTNKFEMVGLLHKKTRLAEIFDKLTSIVMVDDCNSIYHMYAFINILAQFYHLKFVAIGGDMWTRDVIQTIKNVIEMRDEKSLEFKHSAQDQLFLITRYGGAATIKANDYHGKFSYVDYLEMLTHLVPHIPREVLHVNYTEMRSKINSDLLIQGRVSSSDPNELLSKIMVSPALENYLTSHPNGSMLKDHIKEYFRVRINRLPMNDQIVNAATCNKDSRLIILIIQLSTSFLLPTERWSVTTHSVLGRPLKRRMSDLKATSSKELFSSVNSLKRGT